MTSPTRSKFVFRQPKLSYVTNVYKLPFHWTVWISTLALVIIAAFVLYIVVRWECYKDKIYNINKDRQTEFHNSLGEVMIIAFGAVCQQGAPGLPSGVPGRIVSIMMFLSLMFLYTSYSANIVSLLQSPAKTINTLSDLLHSRLGFGVQDTVYNRYYFSIATEPIRKAIFEQKIQPPGQKSKFMSIEEGVRRIRNGLFAFHFEEGIGYREIQQTFFEHEKFGLKDIQYLQVPYPYIPIKKNVPYKEMFKTGLQRIHESGLQAREVGRMYTKKPRCESPGSGFISVSLIDCYPAVVMLLIGIALACFLLLLEIYISIRIEAYHRRKLHNENPQLQQN